MILSIVKWNMEFNLCPSKSKSRMKSVCDKCLSSSCTLSRSRMKWSNVICTSQTNERFDNSGLKLNTPLKTFSADQWWVKCWYSMSRTCATTLLADTRILLDAPLLKSSVKKDRNSVSVGVLFVTLFSVQYFFHWFC